MKPRPPHLLALSTSLLLAAACGGTEDGAGDDVGPADSPTYFQDVKPIVDAKCMSCHADAGIAPFALGTYAEVSEHGPEAELNIAAGLMPPWPPNPDCNDYLADRSLTEEQKATFSAWVEAGMLEGDADNEAPPLDVEATGMSRVDMTMAMTADYTPQTTADYPDEYRCFVMPFPDTMTATQFVTGFRAAPGNPKVVHHVIAFYAAPGEVAQYQALDADEPGDGYKCFGGSGGPSRVMLGGWAPGSLGQDFPAGTGLQIEPGAAVVMQVHYNVLTAGAEPDRTGVELRIDDSVDTVAEIMPWANPQWLSSDSMRIPAGEADAMHAFEFDASLVMGGGFTVYSAASHQHSLGSHNKLTIERAAGGSDCLLQVDDWNFHWQGSYGLREPVQFQSGDKMRVECHWDNSPENQAMIGGEQMPPQDVYWGESTTEEMCLGFFYITRN